jgi:thiamine-monophosphate kinase
LGELELIRKIRAAIGEAAPGTIVGLGDDAAVFEPPSGLELLTCDAFVEGVHFRRDFGGLREIGWKCMVANVSDIAAMGGFPGRATVAVCVPPGTPDDDVLTLYGGALDAAREYGVEVVGGDVVSSREGFVVSISLLGAVGRERVTTRSGAVEGDAVVVTGTLGGAEAGLIAFTENLPAGGPFDVARRRHLMPAPRLAEAQALLDVATPHAMIDVSDGLSSEIYHLAEESRVGVRVHEAAIPVAPEAEAVARQAGRDPLGLALGSGEEFELVATIPASEVARAAEHLAAVTGTPLTRVGEVVGETQGCTLVRGDGTEVALPRVGYEHLAGEALRGGGR